MAAVRERRSRLLHYGLTAFNSGEGVDKVDIGGIGYMLKQRVLFLALGKVKSVPAHMGNF